MSVHLFFLLSVLCAFSSVHAFEITHQLRPNSSYGLMSSNNSCSTVNGQLLSFRCNPALFSMSENKGVYITMLGKVDGDAIDNGRDLIFKPISEDLLRKLFVESSYNSFTLDTSIIFKMKYFALTYSPYYLLADIFLVNPAFPEVSLHLVNREEIRLNSGLELFTNQFLTAHIGTSVYYYEHTHANEIFSLFDLSYIDSSKLINFSTEYGVGSDIGLFVNNSFFYDTKIAFQVKNIGDQIEGSDEFKRSTVRQSTLFLFETYSSLALGKTYSNSVGQFDFNVETPFKGVFQYAYLNHSTCSISYGLQLFSIFISGSKYYQNIGIKFNSENMNIGVTYSKEKDLGPLSPGADNSVYTGLELSL